MENLLFTKSTLVKFKLGIGAEESSVIIIEDFSLAFPTKSLAQTSKTFLPSSKLTSFFHKIELVREILSSLSLINILSESSLLVPSKKIGVDVDVKFSPPLVIMVGFSGGVVSADGVGLGDGEGVGEGSDEGVGETSGDGVGDSSGDGVGEGVGDGKGVGVINGDGVGIGLTIDVGLGLGD